MDFELPEELRLSKETVRNFVDRELIPIEMTSMDGRGHAARRPRAARGEGEEARALASRRAAGIRRAGPEPPRHGGGVGGDRAHRSRCRRAGRACSGRTSGTCCSRSTTAQKEKYLFPVLRGEKKTAFAQSEPDAGSDPGAMRTTAVRHGDHYVINGYKRWITGAADADFLQLVAATDRSKGSRGGLSMFLVDTDTPGVKIVRKTPTMMGDEPARSRSTTSKVPAENMIGSEGDGMKQAQSWITAGRLYQACRGLGVAQALPRPDGELRQAARDLRRAARRAAGGAVHDRRQPTPSTT